MTDEHSPPPPQDPSDELDALARKKQPSVIGEVLYFLGTNKKWWLTPIIVVLLLLGVLVVLGGSGVAPFIYTVF
jgi:hypothetical protein